MHNVGVGVPATVLLLSEAQLANSIVIAGQRLPWCMASQVPVSGTQA
jgi:hypothetical protein